MTQAWDARGYDQRLGIVTAFGADLLDWLAPQPGESILDLGCGTGHLTAEIARRGAHPQGIDASPAMVERARALYPAIPFQVADGTDFQIPEPVDAVFSNAALHWMRPPLGVIRSVAGALKPGGRFVAEMGGERNVTTIQAAIAKALTELGVPAAAVPDPWYFPSLSEYATLLEQNGFRVAQIVHFARPTPLDDCPEGIADWIRILGQQYLEAVPAGKTDQFLSRVNELTRPALCTEGRWVADYWRLRFQAIRL